MKLLTLDQADFSSDDVVFREAAAPSAIWTVLATLGAVGLIAWRVYGDLPLIFPLIGVPGLLLFALLTAAQFRKARLNTNWLLAASGRRVLIKYRSYLNTNLRPDDPQVVSLDCAEIRSTGETALSLKVSGSGHDVPERVLIRCLDIVVDCELAPLNERLAYERGLAGYNGATWHDYPESVRDDSTIRIEWKNSYKITRPGVREAMAAIGRPYRADVLHVAVDLTGSSNSAGPTDIDSQILLLTEWGRRIEAIKLVRRRYGYGLKDAKQFIDELSGRTRPQKKL